jgi:hypothetical protein
MTGVLPAGSKKSQPGRRPAPIVLLGQLLRGNRWLLVPAGLGVIATPLVAITIHHAIDPLNISIWEFAGQPLRWLMFASGVVLGVAMPVVIAHGVTRRTFAAAATLFIGLVALAAAGYMTAGYLVERAAYAATDLPYTVGDDHLFTGVEQVHLLLAEYALAFAGYLTSGWLVAVCYYRLGPVRGTLCLPLTVLPLVAVEGSLIASSWFFGALAGLAVGERYQGLSEPLPPLLRIGLAVAAVAAGLLAVRRFTRRLPVRAPAA